MFEITSKRKKLVILGILVFTVTFLLILFSSGFFNRTLPIRCVGEECGVSPVKVEGVEKLTIDNSSIGPEEIIIKKGEGVGIKIVNNDDQVHSVLKLCKIKDKEDYKILEKISVKPNESKELEGFMNPKNKTNTISVIHSPKVGSISYFPNVSRCLISCTTCSGKNPQVKIVLE